MRSHAAVALLLCSLPLAACQQERSSRADASGQVLPGSISDAMLPEDRVTSQPPLDPGAGRAARNDRAEDAKATTAAAPAATAAPEPAASQAAD